MKFEDINFDSHPSFPKGIQAWVKLDNGIEVSVIKGGHSYGSEKGLYEIGVFKNGIMCDPLGWGDEVKGYLSPAGVERELVLLSAV